MINESIRSKSIRSSRKVGTGYNRSRKKTNQDSNSKSSMKKDLHSNSRHLKKSISLDPTFDELSQEVKGTKNGVRREQIRQMSLGCLAVMFLMMVSKIMRGATPTSSSQELLLRGQSSGKSNYQKSGYSNDVSLGGAQPFNSLQPSIETKAFGDTFNDPNREYRILSLGGSTTWGARLDSREEAYPHVLVKKLGANWKITNLAVRATGAFYASQCIESLIREGSDNLEDIDKDFDVILLEYSLNGLDGAPLLLERLRRRYPNAMVVYVHLWSLRMIVQNAKTKEMPRSILMQGHKFTEADQMMQKVFEETPPEDWEWSQNMVADSTQVSMDALDSVNSVSGYVYSFPLPNKPSEALDGNWFGSDHHHLSKNGHEVVAKGIHELLKTSETAASPMSSGDSVERSWGKGDQCTSWYETGQAPNVKFEGGLMKMFVTPDKWALHVGQRFGTYSKIEFNNFSDKPQPVEVAMMAWGEPSVYPKTKFKLMSAIKPKEAQIIEIDPLNPDVSQRIYHVLRTVHVGFAEPGKNLLEIEPIESTERALRVTGIVMCGACAEIDRFYLTGEPTMEQAESQNLVPRDNSATTDQRPIADMIKAAHDGPVIRRGADTHQNPEQDGQ